MAKRKPRQKAKPRVAKPQQVTQEPAASKPITVLQLQEQLLNLAIEVSKTRMQLVELERRMLLLSNSHYGKY